MRLHAIAIISTIFYLMHQSQLKRTLKCYKSAPQEIYFIKSESILLVVTNITALNKMILYTFTSYLPHSQSQAVPALPGQNSMPIGWGNLGHLFYWLKIPQICCCYIWGSLELRWGRKVPQLIPQNFKHSDSDLLRRDTFIDRWRESFLWTQCFKKRPMGWNCWNRHQRRDLPIVVSKCQWGCNCNWKRDSIGHEMCSGSPQIGGRFESDFPAFQRRCCLGMLLVSNYLGRKTYATQSCATPWQGR